MKRFLTRASIVLLLALVVLAPVTVLLSRQLETWTGETDPRFQVVNLFSPFTEPQLETDDYAPIANDTLPYGVNVFLEQEVEEWKLRKTFELMKSGGVRWIRQQVPWKDIEVNSKGTFTDEYGETWAKYDRFIDMAAEYNIQIMARLDSPPDWSRTDNRVHNRPPDNLQDYLDFCDAFATRYKGKVDTYQIWNEPNIFPEWGWREVDAPAYADLLIAASERLRAANPNAIVVAAALAPTNGTPDGYNENDLLFLQKLYDNGAGGAFDVMSAMGYSPWTGPQDRRADADRVNFSRVRLIRDVMVRNGDANKPLWIAELGWNALPADYEGTPTHGRVTREQQARYITDAYTRAEQEWPWVGMIFLWNLRLVHDENRDQTLYYFGLADADFTLHPAYFAFQQLATRQKAVPPGRRSESHPAISTAGTWKYEAGLNGNGYFLRSNTAGDAIAFQARGNEVSILMRRGPDLGTMKVLVDGKPANQLIDGRLSLSVRDSTWRPILVATDLGTGDHRIDIINESGTLDFDGVIVRPVPDNRGVIGVGMAVSVAMLLAVLLGATNFAIARAQPLVRRLPVRAPRWRHPVWLPVDLWRELTADVPKERLPSFVAAAVAEALRRRREGAQTDKVVLDKESEVERARS